MPVYILVRERKKGCGFCPKTWTLLSFLFFFLFLKTGFLCVALAGLELRDLPEKPGAEVKPKPTERADYGERF